MSHQAQELQKDPITSGSSISNKTAQIYAKQYELFIAWCKNNNITEITEDVLITYMTEKAETHKSSTLWSTYSMLRSTLLSKNNIDIRMFNRLLQFIRSKSEGYKSKSAKVFTQEDIRRFLMEAPDYNFLFHKLCLIFGIIGACRREDFVKMSIDNIKDKGDILVVTLPDPNFGTKTFTVNSIICDNVKPINLYRTYLALRPPETQHKRLFVFYGKGKCTIQPVGINTFGKIPKTIATYLKLSDADCYTGFTFRKTSACLFDNNRKLANVASILNQKSNFDGGRNTQLVVELEDHSMNEHIYLTDEAEIENECEDRKNSMINITDTKVLFNKEEPVKKSDEKKNLTAMECNVFGDYLSQHLQQLPADVALKLQLRIHDLVLQTRLEHVRNNPSEAPVMVKQNIPEETSNPVTFVNVPDNLVTPDKCTSKRMRHTEPPDPNKRLKSNTDSLTTGQAIRRIDVEGFTKHINLQLEKLPVDVSLQLQSDIYNLIQQSARNTEHVTEENCINIKNEVLFEHIDVFS